MTVHCEVYQEIHFNCENCGKINIRDIFAGRSVLQDRIDCSWCDHENHVIVEYTKAATQMAMRKEELIKDLNNAADYVGRNNLYSQAIETAIQFLEEAV